MNQTESVNLPFNLPDFIWLKMLDLHKRISTALPENRRNYWVERIDEFYRTNFTNQKPE